LSGHFAELQEARGGYRTEEAEVQEAGAGVSHCIVTLQKAWHSAGLFAWDRIGDDLRILKFNSLLSG
jgi:hypothetical protein